MLFDRSEKLRRTDNRVKTYGTVLRMVTDDSVSEVHCLDVSPGGLKVSPVCATLAPGSTVRVSTPTYFREIECQLLRHDEDGSVLLFTDPDQALAFVGILSAMAEMAAPPGIAPGVKD